MRELIITSGGEALAARLIGESASARFTRICASSADYSDREPGVIKELSELSEIRQSAAVSGTRRVDVSTVEIFAAMDNTEIQKGYYTRTLGLYAEDQDKNEILFAVCSDTQSPFYMPPYAGATVSGVSYKLRVKVSNSERIEIGASAEIYATALQLDEAVTRINDRIDALSFTEEINEHNENSTSHPKLVERLDDNETRLDNIDTRLGNIDTRLGKIDTRLNGNDTRLSNIDTRLDGNDTRLNNIDIRLGNISTRLDDIGRRMELAEIVISGDITSNPFAVTFGSLSGTVSDGVWNSSNSRLEF